ncbi:hypothetical protein [Xenorhabdus stockiae]|uniref:hypothetical protein n=1 Tax=Xenorhabdus stockiae TaxID=351614 RepID=UPI001145FBE8|nr:hypothetical protein [Xenorhabdus stockiae]
MLSIIRLLLQCDGFIRLCGSNAVNDAGNNYEKISSLPNSWLNAFNFNANLFCDLLDVYPRQLSME